MWWFHHTEPFATSGNLSNGVLNADSTIALILAKFLFEIIWSQTKESLLMANTVDCKNCEQSFEEVEFCQISCKNDKFLKPCKCHDPDSCLHSSQICKCAESEANHVFHSNGLHFQLEWISHRKNSWQLVLEIPCEKNPEQHTRQSFEPCSFWLCFPCFVRIVLIADHLHQHEVCTMNLCIDDNAGDDKTKCKAWMHYPKFCSVVKIGQTQTLSRPIWQSSRLLFNPLVTTKQSLKHNLHFFAFEWHTEKEKHHSNWSRQSPDKSCCWNLSPSSNAFETSAVFQTFSHRISMTHEIEKHQQQTPGQRWWLTPPKYSTKAHLKPHRVFWFFTQ